MSINMKTTFSRFSIPNDFPLFDRVNYPEHTSLLNLMTLDTNLVCIFTMNKQEFFIQS